MIPQATALYVAQATLTDTTTPHVRYGRVIGWAYSSGAARPVVAALDPDGRAAQPTAGWLGAGWHGVFLADALPEVLNLAVGYALRQQVAALAETPADRLPLALVTAAGHARALARQCNADAGRHHNSPQIAGPTLATLWSWAARELLAVAARTSVSLDLSQLGAVEPLPEGLRWRVGEILGEEDGLPEWLDVAVVLRRDDKTGSVLAATLDHDGLARYVLFGAQKVPA